VAQPQPELPLLYFSAEFELLLGGGEAEGGEGIHVFFGPAGEISRPPAPPPELEPCPPTGTLARTLAITLALTLTRRDAAAARAAYA
jgi:hypothetical protein